MSESRIEVEFKADASDYRRVLLWYRWKWFLLTAVIWLIIIVPILYLVAFGAGSNPFDEKAQAPVLVFSVLLILPLLLAISFYFTIWQQARKIANITEDATVTFDVDGVSSVAKSSSSQMIWERFSKVRETKQDFIFFPQENIFYPIPKRLFSDPAQIEALRSLIRSKLGKRAKLNE